jgi:DNA-binding NtrC family response regulator
MKRKKILIIDDEKDFGFLMKSFFTKKDFDVSLAFTLGEGMRMLKEELPDVVFLDNNLPDGMGWGETMFILVNYPLIRLNLISAMNAPKTSASSFRILEKPLVWEDLNDMMESDFPAQQKIS